MPCPANMLGYLRAIRPAQTGASSPSAVIPSRVCRFFSFIRRAFLRRMPADAAEESLFDFTGGDISAKVPGC